MEASSYITSVRELVGRVQEEAEYISPWPPVHQGLAAAVSELSTRLTSALPFTAVLGTPAGRQLARDLQNIFCQGSVLARYCSADAIAHQSSCAVGFFLGFGKVTKDMPELGVTADTLPLERAAGYVDRAVTEATQLQIVVQGVNKLTALEMLRRGYISAVSNTMTTPAAVARWRLGAASPALEPLLHLAVGELLGGCEMAAEQLGGLTATGPAQRTGQAEQQQQELLLGAAQSRGNCAALVMMQLLPLAEAAASQGRLNLQHLMDAAPGFISFLDLYAMQAGQLAGMQLDMLYHGGRGITAVLNLQQRSIHSLCGQRPSSTQKASLKAALDQRMQWVAAAAAATKVLHSLADASDSGSSRREAGWVGISSTSIHQGLDAALLLLGDVLVGTPEVDCAAYKDCIGDRPALAKLPGAVLPLLELAELLLRLTPKRQVFVAVGVSGQAAADEHGQAASYMMKVVQYLIVDIGQAPSLLPLGGHQAQGPRQPVTELIPEIHSPGGSSNSPAAPAADVVLQGVASLAGTAAKSVEAPGPQRSLTRHLKSTGFLAFLCLPALSEVHGRLSLQGRNVLTGRREAINFAADLLQQLKSLQLMDDAVRGGGLGPLLNRYLQMLLAPRYLDKALPLLLLLCQILGDEHTEGLAVALVRDGLLQIAAEHSARLAKDQSIQSAKGMLPLYTVMLVRAVCSVLDENASTGLLATFSALLEGVPSMEACVGMTSGVIASRGQFVLPRGPWVARFRTKPAWEQVRSGLLPALSAACEGLTSDSQRQHEEEGMFRDVAVSAWTCCNPGCTNMAGQHEASLTLSKCTGCGEARYCSKQCQRQDWRRHKPICQAIRELK